MVREFDERNMARSRERCAAMEDMANSMRRRAELRHDCEKGAKEVRHISRQENDAVASPAHYTSGGIEAKDALRAAMDGSELSPMAFYWWGCAFKYMWRWSRKNGVEDLRKCRQCIDFLIEEVEG